LTKKQSKNRKEKQRKGVTNRGRNREDYRYDHRIERNISNARQQRGAYPLHHHDDDETS
jgi:hypothetical protein